MPFSDVTSDTACNRLGLALEVAVALNKRCAIAGVAGVTVPSVGANLKTFVRACQDKIQTVATAFCNPTATLAGQSSLPSSWSLPSAMTAAGLTSSGYWRRIPSGGSLPSVWSSYGDAAYSYGLADQRDLIGPWLFADLFAALSKLTRHVSDPDDNDVDYYAIESNSPPAAYAPFELSGNVSLSTYAGPAYDGKATVAIGKEFNGSVYEAGGIVTSMRLLLPRRDISGASETRTIVYIPRGDIPFTSITGLTAGQLEKTVAVAPAELGTGYAIRWIWGAQSAINGLNVSWSSLSSQLAWQSGVFIDRAAVELSPSDACLVTDYDYGDGATS